MAAEPKTQREAAPFWHTLTEAQVLAKVHGSEEGLSTAEAEQRLQRHGLNRLPQPQRAGPLRRFALQFHNVLIYVLLTAALGTALLNEWIDTAVILGVVLINAAIGFVQEGKAEKALDAIRDMLAPKARVLRDGRRRTVAAEELVVGDLVLLEAGDRVPADLRLVHVNNLRIDEAVLTGESLPVDKTTEPAPPDAELGDRTSLAFSGTLVVAGRTRGLVVATGAATEIGRVSEMLAGVESTTTPLLEQTAQFGRWLSAAIIAAAGATFAFGLLVRDYLMLDMFLAAVSLAVAAIPEGLPAIMTVTLAIGVQRMARRNAIIRRLPAVETLGAVTCICSDKTGTLTRNEMTVQGICTADGAYSVTGVGYAPDGRFQRNGEEIEPAAHPLLHALLEAGVLCNDAALHEVEGQWTLEGDPTEGALLTAAHKAALDPDELVRRHRRVDSIPFEPAYKFMVTLHAAAGGSLIVMKGAPEQVLAACSAQRTVDGDRALDEGYWQRAMQVMAQEGQRLLALAVRTTETRHERLEFAQVESDMVLLGIVGLLDPPREEAIRAVAKCQAAGIRIKMITGDHLITAQAIAARVGIRGHEGAAVAGHQLDAMDAAEFSATARSSDVFARAAPEHKLRLVQSLQASGDVVAMTGDGVNDAPALKRADVGVAMGRKGTEAAKEASEMVLADDNFASIANAVEEGRTVYDNLKKAILFTLPTNGGQALTIVAAILLGLALPLTPVQVLWVNMVTAVTLALALAFEPPEPGIMERPPRPRHTPLLSGFLLWRVAFVSVLLVAGTFGHYAWMMFSHGNEELARTAAINTLVVGQIFYLFNSRYVLEPVINRAGLLGSRPVLIAVALLIVLQMLFTYAAPLQQLFGTVPMQADQWVRAVVFGLVLFLLVEAEKVLLRPSVQRHQL